MNKRAKSTQPNPSPRSSTQQSVRNASRSREVQEAEAQVGKWLDCSARNYLKGTCTTPFCEKWHPPECLFNKSEKDANLEKSALTHPARLMNSLAKGIKGMRTKVQWLC